MSDTITLELRPPRWWKAGRIVFYVFGGLNALMGLAIVALVIWLSEAGGSPGLPPLGLGLPRLRTNESVRVVYGDIRRVLLMRIPALRMRVFVRTAQGDFFVHRTWLPPDWTLERLASELARRRHAAKATPP